MKIEFSENQKELVEAVVGLFILLPNPKLKGRKKEIMKIAFEVLSKQMENYIEVEEELSEEEQEYDDFYYEFLMESED